MKIPLLYIFLVLFAFIGTGWAQEEKLLVSKNYDGQPFFEFIKEIEEQHSLQFYYFSGWISTLKVQQKESPTTVETILTQTLQGTGIQYSTNANGQVFLSSNQPIQQTFNLKTEDQIEVMIPESVSSNLEQGLSTSDLQQKWVIIGDPAAPEQKPKVTLSGYVYNKETEEPLADALLFVEELGQGTTTDEMGYYQLSLPQGRYQIIFQSIGLKEATQKVKLYASGDMDVLLGELILNIEEVVVRANRKESVRGVQMGVEALKIETIKELPTLFGEVDVVRSALMLPGVQSAGEFSSGINVRGGGADQNLILLNGAPVFNASHLFGFSSSFSPDVIEGFELYKSSIPAKYGGRISSVLDLEMKEGEMDRWTLRGGVSPVTSRLTVEGPLVQDKTSLILSGRSTYSNWILKRLENAAFRNSSANYADLSVRVKTQFQQNNSLDISAYLSNDAFQLNGDTTYNYQNRNIVAKYQKEFSEQLFGTFSGVYSQYQFNVNSNSLPIIGFDLSYQINYAEGKAHFSYAPSDKHQVNFGTSIVHYQLSPGTIAPKSSESIITDKELENEQALEASIYVSDEWTLSDKFSIYGGLRFTQYLFLGSKTILDYQPNAARIKNNIIGSTTYDKGEIVQSYSGPEYRVSFRYAIDENNSIKAAFNRNRQYLSMLFNSATVSPTATWKLSDPHVLPQTSDQLSVGVFRNMLGDQLEASVEGYYKRIQNMLEYKAGATLLLNEHLETDIVNGDGKAYGVEFLLRKIGRKLNGWMSYTYSRTRFRADSPYAEDRINQGDWFPTNFDKPHDFSLVGFYKVSKRFSVSSSWNYSTGRPVTIPVAKYLFNNGTRLQYSRRNEFRVPDYFRWDLSINLEGNHKLKKLAHSSWSLSVYNMTGRRNVYSVYFNSDGQTAQGYRLSIFGRPFFTLTYNFRF